MKCWARPGVAAILHIVRYFYDADVYYQLKVVACINIGFSDSREYLVRLPLRMLYLIIRVN
jgi:hypothetical protein